MSCDPLGAAEAIRRARASAPAGDPIPGHPRNRPGLAVMSPPHRTHGQTVEQWTDDFLALMAESHSATFGRGFFVDSPESKLAAARYYAEKVVQACGARLRVDVRLGTPVDPRKTYLDPPPEARP